MPTKVTSALTPSGGRTPESTAVHNANVARLATSATGNGATRATSA